MARPLIILNISSFGILQTYVTTITEKSDYCIMKIKRWDSDLLCHPHETIVPTYITKNLLKIQTDDSQVYKSPIKKKILESEILLYFYY